MTYLIQNKKTREYFQQGAWTYDSGWAEEFSDVGKAILACLRYELREVELILRFGAEMGRNYSLQLSLPESLGLGPPNLYGALKDRQAVRLD